ncbi:butyrate kinase [Natranaerobius thermophilus]|uniref:Probable butyrate kinase n=1 Tax=Natranaerobius thermophilus (strain ATCC BAA-1301 / DSM 18059 / JW/NM-WN-LF) TaxID=457570 RepID=B2A512_NATTJ|nr:butyrate kinase [Natranaerobius thermophilus]ACB85254.1 butyrate kinase [Natranaerobius thermophilus JW/NM-WN-LF]
MKQEHRLLVINPGSTSTKIAVYEGESPLIEKKLEHSPEELNKFQDIIDQYDFRKDSILNFLDEQGMNFNKLDAVVARGGLLKPISGGTFKVNDLMVEHLRQGYQGEHASNLGGIIAKEISNQLDIPAYIVDPVVVDELQDIARISGFEPIERKSIFHALNHKAVARKAAAQLGKKYEEANLVVVHLGGGISVGAHNCGDVIDVNNALDGEGPFSPERSGGLPNGDLVRYIDEHNLTWKELKRQLVGNGGLVSYLDTNDGKKVQEMIQSGDEKAEKVYEAMIYQIAKEIGSCAVVLKGELDAIVLTGGLAHDEYLVSRMKEYIKFLGEILVFPGEDEMQSLAEGGLRVLRNEETPKDYS